jgi:hypothetical protein
VATGCFSAPPQIISLNPANNSTGVPADTPIRIVFDHAVDPASLPSRLSIDPPLPACPVAAAFSATADSPCHVDWDRSGSGLTLVHQGGTLFAPSTKYTVTLGAGVADSAGLSNSLVHHWAFTTGAAPAALSLGAADGAAGVFVDSTLVVAFSAPMAVAPTLTAIRLTPPVPDTVVAVNPQDHSRFVVVPGRLLDTNRRYTLSIERTATDEHGQPLDAARTATFTTGGLSQSGHGLVLAGRLGEPASTVLLTATGAAQAGDPVAAAAVLVAPRCVVQRCGSVARDGPLLGYLEATVSTDGRRLAVVERDETPDAPPPPTLHLISLSDGGDVVIAAGADRPSWSPEGKRLAYSAQDGIHLLNLMTGEDRRLPAGDPLVGPVRWSGDGAFLALPVRSLSGHEHVDLADPYLLARFPVPSMGADVADPVLNGDGTELAVSRSGDAQVAGTWLVRMRTADASPRRLGTDIRPLAYADAGTLLAVERLTDSPAGLIRVTISTGDRVRVGGSIDSADLPTVTAASSGRQLGFLHTDNLGVVQAFVANADGSNPTQLTRFAAADGRIAFAIALAA